MLGGSPAMLPLESDVVDVRGDQKLKSTLLI
jgi:hypothetical protein